MVSGYGNELEPAVLSYAGRILRYFSVIVKVIVALSNATEEVPDEDIALLYCTANVHYEVLYSVCVYVSLSLFFVFLSVSFLYLSLSSFFSFWELIYDLIFLQIMETAYWCMETGLLPHLTGMYCWKCVYMYM